MSRYLSILRLRLRSLFRRRAVEQELADEFAFGLAAREAEEIARGRSAEEARRIARASFDGWDRQMEACRDQRRVGVVENFARDVRVGVRAWRRTPGLFLLAAATLALGFGANATIFSFLDSIFYWPLAKLDAARVHVIRPENAAQRRQYRTDSTLDDFLAWRSTGIFSRIVMHRPVQHVFGGERDAERVAGTAVTPGFFALLGARPALGRLLEDADTEPGAAPALVLSYAYWQQRFGSRPDIAGQSLLLDGVRHTIAGVAPPDLWFPKPSSRFWTPLPLHPTPASHAERGGVVFAELRPGVTLAEAQARLSTLAAALEQRFPASHQGWTVRIASLYQGFFAPAERTINTVLRVISLGVLLIACANVANLLLARGLLRRREVAIRTALGAGRLRILGQTLTEGLVLAAPAALLGGVVALAAAKLLLATVRMPVPERDLLDTRFLAANALAALGAALVFALYPAIAASRSAESHVLQEGGPRSTSGRAVGLLSRSFVAAQVCLAFALVLVSLVAARGIRGLVERPAVYERAGLLRAVLDPAPSRYPGPDARQRFFEQVRERVASTPGVESAALTSTLPGLSDGAVTALTSAVRPAPPRERPSGAYLVFSPGAVETLRLPLLRGRSLLVSDSAAAPPVALVNQALAEILFPGADPLGQQILLEDFPNRPFRIVGLYPNLPNLDPQRPRVPQAVLSSLQAPQASMVVMARTGPATPVSALRAAVTAVDPLQPPEWSRLTDDFATATSNARTLLRLLSVLAALALFLASAGVFALVSHTVLQRLPEVAVRMALGASPGSIARLIAGFGSGWLSAGLAAGLILGLLLGTFMGRLFVGIRPWDWQVLAPAAAAFLAAALTALGFPLRRALREDNLRLLRRD